MKKGWIVIIGVLVVVIVYFFTTYNSLVKKDEDVKQFWSNLQATYQRRTDLIPGLVGVVKGASDYEKGVLTQLAEARAKAASFSVSGEVNFQKFQALEQTQGELANAMNRTVAVVEGYPDLKATKNFLYLQKQLEGTERRIQVARVDFNQAVMTYNNKVRTFPSNVVAKTLGFKSKEGFAAAAGASQAPRVNF